EVGEGARDRARAGDLAVERVARDVRGRERGASDQCQVGSGLAFPHVQHGGREASRLERREKSRAVGDRTARRVEHDGAGPQARELASADQMMRRVPPGDGERRVERDRVRGVEDAREREEARVALALGARRVAAEDFHPERGRRSTTSVPTCPTPTTPSTAPSHERPRSTSSSRSAAVTYSATERALLPGAYANAIPPRA